MLQRTIFVLLLLLMLLITPAIAQEDSAGVVNIY